jgi:hypothetical protein
VRRWLLATLERVYLDAAAFALDVLAQVSVAALGLLAALLDLMLPRGRGKGK